MYCNLKVTVIDTVTSLELTLLIDDCVELSFFLSVFCEHLEYDIACDI